MDRRAISDRQRTITNKENENIIENSNCSQEDNPGSHISWREVEHRYKPHFRKTNDKKKKIKVFHMFEYNHDEFSYVRKMKKRAGALADTFRKSYSIKKCVTQHEKSFTLVFL